MADWSRDMQSASAASAAQCASMPTPAPRIAICTAGAARTFASPLVFESWRHNFVSALAGAADSRVFLLLKTLDSDKRDTGAGHIFRQHHETSFEGLELRLNHPWLARMLADVLIVNGSGAPPQIVEAGRLGPVVQPDDNAWKQWRCRLHSGNDPDEERLCVSILALRWCNQAIRRFEASSEAPLERPFELVAFSRPDLVWWAPMPPWCAWNISKALLSFAQRSWVPADNMWVLPRQAADAALDLASVHRDCEQRDAPCCGSRMEPLLRFALRGVPIHQNWTLWQRIGESISVLRAAQSACEMVTSRVFGKALISSRERIGITLPFAAASHLRRLFGLSLPSCREALWASPCDELAARLNRTTTAVPAPSRAEYACLRGQQAVPDSFRTAR